MTTAPSSPSPDDPDALAARAADSSLSADERTDSFVRLVSVIDRQAQRVCVRFSGQTRRDLLSEASRVVWEAMPRYTAGRPFEPWCRAVLKNWTISTLRRSTGHSVE